MDMGGTEVAMAALLQKTGGEKEDVTLLLVEKEAFCWSGFRRKWKCAR